MIEDKEKLRVLHAENIRQMNEVFMKRMLFGLCALASISSLTYGASIKLPMFNKYNISCDSNMDLVCRSFGHDRSTGHRCKLKSDYNIQRTLENIYYFPIELFFRGGKNQRATMPHPLKVIEIKDPTYIEDVFNANGLTDKGTRKIISKIECEGKFENRLRKQCGLEGSLEERVASCSNEPFSTIAGWTLITYANKKETMWLNPSRTLIWRSPLTDSWGRMHASPDKAEELCSSASAKYSYMKDFDFKLPTTKDFAELRSTKGGDALSLASYELENSLSSDSGSTSSRYFQCVSTVIP